MAGQSPDQSDQTSSAIIGEYPAQAAVACLPWNPRAPEVAARVVELLTARRPELCCEHIGSTAVPGCDGKGILDLMLIYPDGSLDEVKSLLDGLGFQRQTIGYLWPEERPMRVGSILDGGETFLIHVHVLHDQSPEIEVFRTFRDQLLADTALRSAYVEEKRRICADGVETRLEYTKIKGAFIQRASSAS
jgi:GrpB-like predicted nucleotidyltransferase (UPF0157 family)